MIIPIEVQGNFQYFYANLKQKSIAFQDNRLFQNNRLFLEFVID